MDAALTSPLRQPLPSPSMPLSSMPLSSMMERLRQGDLPRADVDDSRIDPTKRDQIHRKASEFEAMFIGQMLTPLFESMPVDEQFGGGKGEEMFRGMLVQEYGKQMMARGGFGLADQVYRELLRAQEASNG